MNTTMAGLRMICKMYGGMKFTDKDGKTIEYVWDYSKDEPRIKSEMSREEITESEKAKWKILEEQLKTLK